MNFTDTMASVELVLAANQVPLLVGETGIGKTSLAARVAESHDWELVTIDGNLLKEGEIGGLPTVETVSHKDSNGAVKEIKTTVYAVHQTIDMDPAQQNRFVWLYMEADYMQWIDWAISAGIEDKVVEFISSYPDYLNQRHEDDIDATPRSFERISHIYGIYKEGGYSCEVFQNVIRGNVGKLIAEAFVNFVETEQEPLISFDDVLEAVHKPGAIMSLQERVNGESPHMTGRNYESKFR